MAESMTNHQQAFGDLLWRRIVIVLPYLWLILFFLVPFAIVFKISFSDPIVAQPPFTPLFDQSQSFLNWFQGSLNNYLFLLEDNLYWVSYLRSIKVAFISTICCLLLGYPMAYYIAQSAPTKRNVLLMLIILPFWTSFLLRVYAWMGILSTNGIINSVFLWIGVIDDPIQMLYTNFAVYLGIVYT